MKRWLLALSALLSGCAREADPAWAIDPIVVTPIAGGIHAFQTWQLYRAGWERSRAERMYVCAVVVELQGVEAPCTDCQLAWDTSGSVVDSDCGPTVESDPTWTSLRRLSLGLPLLAGEGPVYAGVSSRGFADYGWGWEVHGQAWPEALDHGGAASSGDWDGEQVFRFEPELAWPMP